MPRIYVRRPLTERFWERVRCGQPNECWLWTGKPNSAGYGRIAREPTVRGVSGRVERAHRVSWEIHNGPIPSGLHVCHHCDNPPCVNPSHLFLGTDADNHADMTRKGRSVIPVGEHNGRAVMNAELVRRLRARWRQGETFASLSRWSGVCYTSTRNAVLGVTWGHVK